MLTNFQNHLHGLFGTCKSNYMDGIVTQFVLKTHLGTTFDLKGKKKKTFITKCDILDSV